MTAAIQPSNFMACQEVYLHIVPTVKENDAPANLSSALTDKVMKIAGAILITLGAFLILSSPAIIGMAMTGAIAGGVANVQPLLTLGVISMIAGSHLWQTGEHGKASLVKSWKLGDMTVG